MVLKIVRLVFGEERRLNKMNCKVASFEGQRTLVVNVDSILVEASQDVIKCRKLSYIGHRRQPGSTGQEDTVELRVMALGISEITRLFMLCLVVFNRVSSRTQ